MRRARAKQAKGKRAKARRKRAAKQTSSDGGQKDTTLSTSGQQQNQGDSDSQANFMAEFRVGDDAQKGSLVQIWNQMSKEQQIDLLSLTEEAVVQKFVSAVIPLEQRGLLDASSITVKDSTIRMAQASMVQALQISTPEDEGVTVKVPPQLEQSALRYYIFLAALQAIEEKLLLCYEKQELHIKAWFVLLYFAWCSRFRWVSLFVIGVATVWRNELNEVCVRQFCALVDVMLVHSKKPDVVVWHSHMYITGLLLFFLAESPAWYIVIGSFTVLPYILGEIEKHLSDSADVNAMRYIRSLFQYLNKLLLLYIAWGEWPSLILAILLFFKTVAVAAMYLVTLVVTQALFLGFELIRRLLPATVRQYITGWWHHWYIKVITYIVLTIGGGVAFHLSEEWGSLLGPAARMLLSALGFIILWEVWKIWPSAWNRILEVLLLVLVVPLFLMEHGMRYLLRLVQGCGWGRWAATSGSATNGGKASQSRQFRWSPDEAS